LAVASVSQAGGAKKTKAISGIKEKLEAAQADLQKASKIGSKLFGKAEEPLCLTS